MTQVCGDWRRLQNDKLICTPHQLLLHNEIQEDKMDIACDIYV